MALLNAFTIETPEVVGVASDRRGETTLNAADFGKRALFDGNVTIPLALVADLNRTQTVVNVTGTALTLTPASGVTITGQTTVPPYGVVDLVVLSTTGSATTWVASEGDADKADKDQVGVRTYASYSQAELDVLAVGTPVLGADLELYKLAADAKAEQLADAADATARTNTTATHGQWLLQVDTGQNYYYSTISDDWVVWNGTDPIPADPSIAPAAGVRSWQNTRVEIISHRYQMTGNDTDIQAALDNNDVVSLARGVTYTNTTPIKIPPRTTLEIPAGAVISRVVADNAIDPIIWFGRESSKVSGQGEIISDGAIEHGRVYFGPQNGYVYQIRISTTAGSPVVTCPDGDMRLDAVAVGFREPEPLNWEYYDALTNITVNGFTIDRNATETATKLATVITGGALTSVTRCTFQDVRVKGAGAGSGDNFRFASAPQGSGFGTFFNLVINARSEQADRSGYFYSQANNNTMLLTRHLSIHEILYDMYNTSGNKALDGDSHQCLNLTHVARLRSTQFAKLTPSGEPGSSGFLCEFDADSSRNIFDGMVNASGSFKDDEGSNLTTNLARDFSVSANGVGEYVEALNKLESVEWWLAPQVAASAWPNRGSGPATATLGAGAVIPALSQRFRPIDTTTADPHVTLGVQPFDLSATGKATIAVAFRYTGIGTSSGNPRLFEARGATGWRAYIDNTDTILYSITDGTTVSSGTIGPIVQDRDYIMMMTYTNTDVVIALMNPDGTAAFTGSLNVTALGDCTPDINTTVMGSVAGKFVSGEMGDIVIDAAEAWDAQKRRTMAKSLPLRRGTHSYFRAEWETVNA